MGSAKPKRFAALAAISTFIVAGGGAVYLALHQAGPASAQKASSSAADGSSGGGRQAPGGPASGQLGPGGGPGGRGGRAVGVVAVPAALRDFSNRIEALGTLAPKEQVVLSTGAADRVTGVFFEDGQRVKKGQTLLTLRVEEQKALLEQAQASANDMQRVYERNQRLAASQALATADLEKSKSAAESALANVKSIEARIHNYTLVAPFDGVLGFRRVSLGAYVTLGQQVATLIDDSEMRLEFGVPSIHLSDLRPGVKVEAATADLPGRIFTGTLTSIDNAIDPVSRAVKVRATLPNKDGSLRAGMFMTTDMSPKAHQGLAIPEISITAEGSDTYVFVVDLTRQPAVAVKTPVTVGIRERGVVEITKGLHAGDLVITDGVLKVRANAPVKLQSRDATGKSGSSGDASSQGDSRVAAGDGRPSKADLRQ